MLSDKIKTRDQLAQICMQHRSEGKRICFTSGVFDLLHLGHVTYLQQARAAGDILIVAVNSDASVRRIKGSERPIQNEEARIRVIAGLESVTFAFLFDEETTRTSVEILAPDVYVKGGDYSLEQLHSKDLVGDYGGETLVLPFISGYSTTGLINRIINKCGHEGAFWMEREEGQIGRAVFLDRDGTINEHIDYLHDPNRFRLLPKALDAMFQLQESGFRLVVITNQPGIGMGYFSEDDFFRVNKELLKAAHARGVRIDRVFFCPHSLGDQCSCRKPETGLIKRAQLELNLDLSQSYVVGDMTSDIELGRRCGAKTILVQTGRAGGDGQYSAFPDYVAKDLANAAEWILQQSGSRLAMTG